VFDYKTGLFHGENVVVANGINECINGNCTLPGESTVVSNNCQTSVSVFTINYDAPDNDATRGVDASLLGVVVDEENANNYSDATVGPPPPVESVGLSLGAKPFKDSAGNLGVKRTSTIIATFGLVACILIFF
jgi:hypothetical protein